MPSGRASCPEDALAELLHRAGSEQVVAEQVVAEVRRVLSEELGITRAVSAGDDLITDLQLDSVGILTLVVGLEDRFRVALAEEDSALVRTVGELAGLVARRSAEALPLPAPGEAR